MLSEAYSRSDGLGSTPPAIWPSKAKSSITGPSGTAGAQQIMGLH